MPRADLSCPNGLPGIGPEAFEEFAQFHSISGRNKVDQSRGLFHTVWLPKLHSTYVESFRQCPAAVIHLLLTCILSIDFDMNTTVARDFFRLAEHMTKKFHAIRPDESLFAVHDTVWTYPLLLGILEEESSVLPCDDDTEAGDFQIYVYETGLTMMPLHCSIGQWGTEVLFHRFLERSACRTTDPDKATLFYVPVYGTCYKHLTTPTGMHDLVASDGAAEKLGSLGHQYFDRLLEFLEASPWWQRRGGTDHVFLFADGQGAAIWDAYPSFQSRSHFLMTESWCATPKELTQGRRHSFRTHCMSPWKDVTIPGHVDFHRSMRLVSESLPLLERRTLLSFHGRFPSFGETYDHCDARERLLRLVYTDDFSPPEVEVGPYTEEYFTKLVGSVFCAVPAGQTPWTVHLYEAFFAECIPVILSDDFVLPFPERIPWQELSVRWPEQLVGPELVEHLRQFPVVQLEVMREKLRLYRCWVDYWSVDPMCSPYVAAVSTLRRFARSRPDATALPYWNVPEHVASSQEKHKDCPAYWTNAFLEGGDLEGAPQHLAASHQACHRWCRLHSHCRKWSWIPPADGALPALGQCYLKAARPIPELKTIVGAVTGPRLCGQDLANVDFSDGI
eukprot:TRINITY_DN61246_c0_g1_i1.p1 TRINITY_DN61246_c0_g1~~TRINITY_DN61246_c0_g1_i1.p1  ORF type:complete len:633 (-),score=63.43 TRINITY_DN61246_c0_g1_i1:83-1936(-)